MLNINYGVEITFAISMSLKTPQFNDACFIPITYLWYISIDHFNLSFTSLYVARSMWDQVKKAYKEQEDDIHSRLMKQNYEFIPQWWFYLVLFSMVNLAILTCQVNEQVQLSCWGFLIIFAMVSILLLPNAVLISTTANSVRWIYHFLFRLTWWSFI